MLALLWIVQINVNSMFSSGQKGRQCIKQLIGINRKAIVKKSENTIVSLYNPLCIHVLNIVFSVLLKYRIQRWLLKMIKSTEQFLDKGSVKRETTDITE